MRKRVNRPVTRGSLGNSNNRAATSAVRIFRIFLRTCSVDGAVLEHPTAGFPPRVKTSKRKSS